MHKNLTDIFNKLLIANCILTLTILVIITVVDVFGRYLLGLPLSGASEITEIILALIIYLGLPYICKDEGHVTVSILSSNLNNFASKAHSIIINLLVTLILLLISYQLFKHGINLNSYNEITTFLEIPKAPIAFLLSCLTFLAALMNLMNAHHYIVGNKFIKIQNKKEKYYTSYTSISASKSNFISKEENK